VAKLDWIVAQITAREHYAAAVCRQRQGRLRRLYTDVWAGGAAAWLSRGPRALRAFASRRHPEIPRDKVTWFPIRAGVERLRSAARPARDSRELHLRYIEEGRWFCRAVNRHLEDFPADPDRHAYFGYDTGCLETLRVLRERGVLTIVDQIDPAQVEERLVMEESRRWSGWALSPDPAPREYWARLGEEWRLADLVLVNSEWSRRALVEQGVAASKIIVVPLAYEPAGPPPQPRPASGGTLRVLWLGSVILRKGIPYLLEAARLLVGEDVRFTVAGPLGISREAVAAAPPNVEFVGRVTRDQAPALYRQADLFVLPTVSDGFAITQIEAMSFGVPVVATPNCGEVVTPGRDGLIVPARDSRALADVIQTLARDRAALARMSAEAIVKSRSFTLEAFARRIDEAVGRQRGESPGLWAEGGHR